MLVIWLGALFFVAGVLYAAFQALWRGRLTSRHRSAVAGDTLEPQVSGGGFGLAANWPALALMALGAILLLAGAAF
jgi:hypothetical protein